MRDQKMLKKVNEDEGMKKEDEREEGKGKKVGQGQ